MSIHIIHSFTLHAFTWSWCINSSSSNMAIHTYFVDDNNSAVHATFKQKQHKQTKQPHTKRHDYKMKL